MTGKTIGYSQMVSSPIKALLQEVPVRKLKKSKPCPFCPKSKWAYLYRTYNGMFRHVLQEHVYDDHKKPAWFVYTPDYTKKFYVRIYKVFPISFTDYELKGKEQLEAYMESYCFDNVFNPSLRQIVKFEKKEETIK